MGASADGEVLALRHGRASQLTRMVYLEEATTANLDDAGTILSTFVILPFSVVINRQLLRTGGRRRGWRGSRVPKQARRALGSGRAPCARTRTCIRKVNVRLP